MGIISDRRLWLNADGSRVLEEGDPAAASLAATPGYELSTDFVARHGLKFVKGRVVIPSSEPEPEPEPEEAPEPEAPVAKKKAPARKKTTKPKSAPSEE